MLGFTLLGRAGYGPAKATGGGAAPAPTAILLSSIDELDPDENLLLSGDMTDGDDKLLLSGDA